MGSVLTKGYSFGATEEVTATKLGQLVDEGTIQNLAVSTAMIAASAITNAKVSDVSGVKLTNLADTPAGAGELPDANKGFPVVLTTDVSGVLPVANGGSGSATQNFVDLTTGQTVAGVKTFSSFPVTPSSAPTTDYQMANKKYVTDQVGAIPSTSFAAGSVEFAWSLVETSDLSGNYVKAKEITVFHSGTITVGFDLKGGASGGEPTARIYVNGSAVGTERTEITGSYVTQPDENITVVAGDKVQLYIHRDGYAIYVKNFYLKSSGLGGAVVRQATVAGANPVNNDSP